MTKTIKINPLLINSKPAFTGWFLFDQKTAARHNQLIFCVYFIAPEPSDSFNISQLFPYWKQFSQPRSNTRFVKKMHTLISKMETNE